VSARNISLVPPDTGLTDVAIEIATRRRNTLVLVKQAIRNQDLEEADRLITELVPDDEKSGSITESLNRRTGSAR
jgi:hypothetical protein